MARATSTYVCQSCGAQSRQFFGRCPSCGSWNALVEQAALDAIRRGGSLEDRFLEKAGADAEATRKLSWLEGGVS